jgi:hypothetical protein
VVGKRASGAAIFVAELEVDKGRGKELVLDGAEVIVGRLVSDEVHPAVLHQQGAEVETVWVERG